jgi:HEAT repeat protein
MLKHTFILFLFMVAGAQASVNGLLPALTADNLDTQKKARLELLAVCAKASGAGYVNNKSDVIFVAAVKALGQLIEPAGIKALAAQRSKEKGLRRVQIDAALFATGRKEVFQKLNDSSEIPEVRAVAVMGLILSGDTNAAKEAMASGDPVLQVAAIEAAQQADGDTMYDAVVANLGRLQPHLQLQAMTALEFSGNSGFAKTVVPLLQSADSEVQDAASRALARIGTADSVKALMENGRPEALRALGQLQVEGVDKTLKALAADGDDKERATAIEVLAIRGRADLLPMFLRVAAEEGDAAPRAAVEAIGMLGDDSNLDDLTRLMITHEKSRLSRDMLGAIVEISRRCADIGKVVEILVSHMDGASPRSQANILQALVQTESMEAIQPIAEACRSDDEALQKQAIKLLSASRENDVVPILLELAADESISLANHVTMMRGVSRLLAAQPKRRFKRKWAEQALEICRRDEERQMIQDVIDRKS